VARVLIVYKEFPAPSVGHAGGRAVYRFMESLHRRGHCLHLVARLRREEAPLVEETAPICASITTVPHHTALPGPRPVAFARSYLALRRAAARALREVRPDLLHVEVAQTAFALLGLRRPPSSFRTLDVNWYLLEQRAARLRGIRRAGARTLARVLRWFEPWLYRRYGVIGAVSEGDRRLLAPRCAPRPVLTLPLVPTLLEGEAEPAVPPGPNVLFVGAMYRAFNVEGVQWFLDGVWPRVVAEVPDARFYIVGHRPPPEVQAVHDGRRVIVTGFVEDVAPWYRAAAVFVSPLLVAGGILQKVLDALATRVPVVATSVSNPGVGATPGEHLVVADDAEGFAESVVRLLKDPEERARLGQAGRRFVRAHYDLEAAVDRWEAACGLTPPRGSAPEPPTPSR